MAQYHGFDEDDEFEPGEEELEEDPFGLEDGFDAYPPAHPIMPQRGPEPTYRQPVQGRPVMPMQQPQRPGGLPIQPQRPVGGQPPQRHQVQPQRPVSGQPYGSKPAVQPYSQRQAGRPADRSAQPYQVRQIHGDKNGFELWLRTQGKRLAIFIGLAILFGVAEYYAAILGGFLWFAGIFIVQVVVSWNQLSVLARVANYRDIGGFAAKIVVFGVVLYLVALLLNEWVFFGGYAMFLITFFWPGAYKKDRKAAARMRA